MKDTKILIVEDEWIVAKSIKKMLCNFGYNVSYIASSGEEAIKKTEELKPDLILMDIILKGPMDGIEASMKIKSLVNIPVIYLTANADEITLERARISEPYGYILKPFEERDLQISIYMALYKHSMENKLRESEERFRLMADTAPVMIWMTDCEFKYIYLSKPWLVFTGGSLEEEISKEFLQDIHPEDFEKSFEIYRKAFVARDSFRLEYRKKDFSGLYHWFLDTGVPRFTSSGEFIGYIGSATDITERKNIEEEHIKLISSIEQSGESIIIIDINGIIQYVNSGFEKICGYSRDDVYGTHINILQRDKSCIPFYDDLWDSIKDRQDVWSGHIVIKRKNGNLVDMEGTCAPIRNKDGSIINYVSVMHDITEKLKIEKHLRQSQKMEALGTLAGGIAHDFNNVLSGIIGYMELIELGLPEESKYFQYLQKALSGSMRAKDLVGQILTFSRQSEQQFRVINVIPIVKEVIKFIRGTFPKSIDIRQSIKVTSDAITGDPTQIYQVLMNLLTNAFHAIGEEKGLIEISFNDLDLTENDMAKYPGLNPGNYIELSVRDTGCGMEQNILDRIFEPFFTTKKQGEGTGMGLAVVHGIIKSHGGFIFVYSEPLQGSIFQILLPKIESRIKEVKYPVSAIPKGTGRILFVDDDEDMVNLGQELLQTLGYDFISRTASKDALKLFSLNPEAYDLIITDQSMPDMTGIRLTEEVLKIRSDMPVILCTGFRDIPSEEDFRDYGIRDIILKPIRLREIAEKIYNTLNNHRILTS